MFTLLDADREAEAERDGVRWRDAMRPKNSPKSLAYIVVVANVLLLILIPQQKFSTKTGAVIGAVLLVLVILRYEVLPRLWKRD